MIIIATAVMTLNATQYMLMKVISRNQFRFRLVNIAIPITSLYNDVMACNLPLVTIATSLWSKTTFSLSRSRHLSLYLETVAITAMIGHLHILLTISIE